MKVHSNILKVAAVLCVSFLFSGNASAGIVSVQKTFRGEGRSNPFRLKPRDTVRVFGTVVPQSSGCSRDYYEKLQVSMQATRTGKTWYQVGKPEIYNIADMSIAVKIDHTFSATKSGYHRISVKPITSGTPTKPCTFKQNIRIEVP